MRHTRLLIALSSILFILYLLFMVWDRPAAVRRARLSGVVHMVNAAGERRPADGVLIRLATDIRKWRLSGGRDHLEHARDPTYFERAYVAETRTDFQGSYSLESVVDITFRGSYSGRRSALVQILVPPEADDGKAALINAASVETSAYPSAFLTSCLELRRPRLRRGTGPWECLAYVDIPFSTFSTGPNPELKLADISPDETDGMVLDIEIWEERQELLDALGILNEAYARNTARGQETSAAVVSPTGE